MVSLSLKNKTILITGSAGFIGSSLVLAVLRTVSPVTVIGIDSFVSMILVSVLACGLLFQFPLILYGLLACGIVELDTLRRHRPAVIVIILTVAAILTPPDVLSQILLAVPTWLLFEASLLLFRLNRKRFEQKQAAFVDDAVYREEEQKGERL